MSSLFIAHKIGQHYGARLALEDVGFTLERGQMLALLGPSGAGKTTLFRCLAGLQSPDSGRIALDGVEVASLRGRERRRIGLVFQQFNLVPRLSALDNVLAGRLGHAPAWRSWLRRFDAADVARARDCLARVGLAGHEGQRADTLSGGQQQRVAIARALAQQPDLIIADEPVASLDPGSGAGILELLKSICHADGLAVVCSLHQPEYARRYADRVLGLRAGRVVVDVDAASFGRDQIDTLYDGVIHDTQF
ncbi:phosphonate ABC transporter ATP-binding protein [Massilia sp. YIM B02443]|uniref:phosphonate ABC transporter ATP-binding protein n=1 Tax=Massilia sp. YIM B02443 TaxID=3050127 RepID=UPI0025B6F4D9|nr:phosphonate ABC transporter ATP-binding protein [Massilia sp. YIM B02443]MDN4036531.1 phosphonate ABC transporter ATP-binding protein [Massilia sp. YIM B02443]